MNIFRNYTSFYSFLSMSYMINTLASLCALLSISLFAYFRTPLIVHMGWLSNYAVLAGPHFVLMIYVCLELYFLVEKVKTKFMFRNQIDHRKCNSLLDRRHIFTLKGLKHQDICVMFMSINMALLRIIAQLFINIVSNKILYCTSLRVQ